jgi:glycosyltransferase involved in cell wall biosynthesis
MSILFLGDLKNSSVTNTGYHYASESIKKSLYSLKKEELFKTVDTCDFSDLKYVNIKYDFCFLICNPNSLISQPFILKHIKDKCNVLLLHILWETQPFPVKWDMLWKNENIDGFFTPSKFFEKMILEKTTKPVFYTPYGADMDVACIDIEEKKKEDIFTVTFIGQVTKRKGIEDAITGYCRAFSEKKDTQLILKSFRLSSFEDDLENIILRQSSMNSSNTSNIKIYTIDYNITKRQIYDLYRKSSVLLMPSRGEGFCLPAMEAMLVGLPVIYTNWSNLPEICNPEGKDAFDLKPDAVNLPLRCIVDEAVDMLQYGYDVNTTYAIPLKRDIIDCLHFKYKQWKTNKEAYYTSAKENIELIKKYFSYDKVNSYYIDMIKFLKNER